jgi:hypothetical protein
MLETYSLFLEKISCLALTMGETGELGRSLGLGGTAITPSYPAIPERFSGEILR